MTSNFLRVDVMGSERSNKSGSKYWGFEFSPSITGPVHQS